MANRNLLTFGGYTFKVIVNPINTYNRKTKYRWPENKNLLTASSLNFVGKDAETLNIDGEIHSLIGDVSAIDRLRELGDKGEARILMNGRGESLGKWVIENIDEKGDDLQGDSSPTVIKFKVQFKRYE